MSALVHSVCIAALQFPGPGSKTVPCNQVLTSPCNQVLTVRSTHKLWSYAGTWPTCLELAGQAPRALCASQARGGGHTNWSSLQEPLL